MWTKLAILCYVVCNHELTKSITPSCSTLNLFRVFLIHINSFLLWSFCIPWPVFRDYAYPRAIALAIAQVLMAIGHFNFAMAWPGTMYIGTLLVGVGYGAHWAIVPAAASELFGVKNFGALYNFLTVANPAGSLVFSGVIASGSMTLKQQSRLSSATALRCWQWVAEWLT